MLRIFEGLSIFDYMQNCSCAIIGHGDSIERLVRKFPNIRKLRCYLDWKDPNEIEIVIPDSLRQLESLSLRSRQIGTVGLRSLPKRRSEFDFPDNLRKLSLIDFWLHQSDVSRIGKLSNLEFLKFDKTDFQENTLDMVEGEFSKLKTLELTAYELVRWTASDDQFPCLQKLVLSSCLKLEEIPCCFESIDTLQMVKISYCHAATKSFFKGIQDEQQELGNSSLKIKFTDDEE